MTTAESLDIALVEGLVRDAAAAPSMHNAQPWFFHCRRSDRVLELRADPARTMPSADPALRALHIGCGAALLNLRAAAQHAGLRPDIELLPDPSDRYALASVRLTEADPDELDRDLVSLRSAIPQRHTSRYPFAEKPIPERVKERLAGEARTEGAQLTFPTDWHLAMVLDLIDEAELDLEHTGDPDESRWVRIGTALSDTAADGLPEYSLGPRKREGRAPVRDFARGRADTDRGSTAFEHMPQLGLVSTWHDGPRDWLIAGQAMERALLLATRAGLVASFATQALERTDLRWLLRDPARADGPAQMVIRFGYGPQAPHTPRRPVHDILEIS